MNTQKQIFVKELAESISYYGNSLLSIKGLLSEPDKKIYVHGTGNFGTATCKLLENAGLSVSGFIDKNGSDNAMHLSKHVFNTTSTIDNCQFDKAKDIIVIAFICNEESLQAVMSAYSSAGYENVFYFLNIYALFITNNLAIKPSNIFSISSTAGVSFDKVPERVLQVAALWQDEESRATYKSFLLAIFSGNPNLFAAITDQSQYFVTDIPFKKGYSRFIDCGAFDGDTALALKSHKGSAQALACFEPDNKNFMHLSQNLKKQRIASEQILFPCGVWEKSEMLRFRSGMQSTSGISETGDTYVQCVAIDDAIPDFKPTFVKMDVEGAEYEALIGAHETLTTCAPDLAISVYHRIEHMWEIPLLLKSIHSDYMFYLRSHGSYGVETIMYATHK